VTATIDQLELAAAATWSPDTTAYVDGWKVSSNGGFSRRLNSATAVGQAETSLEAKRSVTRWLSERGSPLVVRVTPLTDPTTAESCQRNWYLEPRDETIVMTRAILDRDPIPDVIYADPVDEVFVEEFFSFNGRRPADDEVWSRLAGRVSPDATGLWAKGAAVGFVVVSGALACTYSVAVKTTERRKGLGLTMMAAAESWAAMRGARSMALQVLGTNKPARGLYERLGYSEAYRYHYLQSVVYRQDWT
jgi:ribosomal protein S18 acetylase RimI-like enzyme